MLPEATSQANATTNTFESQNERVVKLLMLEDNPADAYFIERTLKESGCEFISKRVESEAGFQEALESFRPHAVLSDFHLPGFDAFSALAFVREKSPDIPFLIISGVRKRPFRFFSAGRAIT
jgi:CheY-like chemotaxis protein